MRQSWTDDRLDELARRVDTGFEKMDRRFAEARAEAKAENQDLRGELIAAITELGEQMNRRFEQVDKRFEQVDRRFEQVDRRFAQVDLRFDHIGQHFDLRLDSMQGRSERLLRVLVAALFGGVFTLIAAIVALVVAQVA